MRLAFFGTPSFAIATLERLLAGPHEVVIIVSQPDRRRGRGRRVSPSPVSQLALDRGIPLLRSERVGDSEVVEALSAQAPDLGVVVAFGQFLPKRIREAPTGGYLINGHASLLPAYRGAAPIARAILAGETRTGVSVMRVEREMDAGAVVLTRELDIGPDENAGELTERMAELTADALAEALDRIAAGREHWVVQDPGAATLAPRIGREDTHLDWSASARALVCRVRAMAPSPGAFSTLDGDPLRILAARSEPGDVADPPGTVRRTPEVGLRIATGDGWLVPLRLQRPGGRELDVDAFLRGREIPDGTLLGATATLPS